MIVIGYQGIGKSTIAKHYKNCIDLESGSFWYDGKRPDDWYVYYCQIAEHLDDQGYTVFLSSHSVVRSWFLNKSHDHDVVCVVPSLELKDEWIEKLHDRYEETGLEKDWKAWKNALHMYSENISEIKQCGLPYMEIVSMQYDLEAAIKKYAKEIRSKVRTYAR